jgi:hypothetical protein
VRRIYTPNDDTPKPRETCKQKRQKNFARTNPITPDDFKPVARTSIDGYVAIFSRSASVIGRQRAMSSVAYANRVNKHANLINENNQHYFKELISNK